MGGWMGGWMDGCMAGWLVGWMDGWILQTLTNKKASKLCTSCADSSDNDPIII